MLARVTAGKSGIIEYLIDGVKNGRDYSRDELDQRICIDGSIDVTELVLNVTSKVERDNYYHITLSFKETDISVDTMAQVYEEYRDTLLSAYKKDEYNSYAEIHYPILKQIQDKKTGEMRERYPHIHFILPRTNLLTNKVLNPFGEYRKMEKYHNAIVENLNYKFNLASPLDSDAGITSKSDLISRMKGDDYADLYKQTKLSILDGIHTNDIRTWNDFKGFVSTFGPIRENKDYLSVNVGGKIIPLKERCFTEGYVVNRKYPSRRPSEATTRRSVKDWGNRIALEAKHVVKAPKSFREAYYGASKAEQKVLLKERIEKHERQAREPIHIRKSRQSLGDIIRPYWDSPRTFAEIPICVSSMPVSGLDEGKRWGGDRVEGVLPTASLVHLDDNQQREHNGLRWSDDSRGNGGRGRIEGHISMATQALVDIESNANTNQVGEEMGIWDKLKNGASSMVSGTKRHLESSKEFADDLEKGKFKSKVKPKADVEEDNEILGGDRSLSYEKRFNQQQVQLSDESMKLANLIKAVTDNGKTTAYLNKESGKPVFKDTGTRITFMDKEPQDSAVLAAIQLAAEKYGVVKLRGTQAFKDQVINEAAKAGLNVVFEDKDLHEKFIHLSADFKANGMSEGEPQDKQDPNAPKLEAAEALKESTELNKQEAESFHTTRQQKDNRIAEDAQSKQVAPEPEVVEEQAETFIPTYNAHTTEDDVDLDYAGTPDFDPETGELSGYETNTANEGPTHIPTYNFNSTEQSVLGDDGLEPEKGEPLEMPETKLEPEAVVEAPSNELQDHYANLLLQTGVPLEEFMRPASIDNCVTAHQEKGDYLSRDEISSIKRETKASFNDHPETTLTLAAAEKAMYKVTEANGVSDSDARKAMLLGIDKKVWNTTDRGLRVSIKNKYVKAFCDNINENKGVDTDSLTKLKQELIDLKLKKTKLEPETPVEAPVTHVEPVETKMEPDVSVEPETAVEAHTDLITKLVSVKAIGDFLLKQGDKPLTDEQNNHIRQVVGNSKSGNLTKKPSFDNVKATHLRAEARNIAAEAGFERVANTFTRNHYDEFYGKVEQIVPQRGEVSATDAKALSYYISSILVKDVAQVKESELVTPVKKAIDKYIAYLDRVVKIPSKGAVEFATEAFAGKKVVNNAELTEMNKGFLAHRLTANAETEAPVINDQSKAATLAKKITLCDTYQKLAHDKDFLKEIQGHLGNVVVDGKQLQSILVGHAIGLLEKNPGSLYCDVKRGGKTYSKYDVQGLVNPLIQSNHLKTSSSESLFADKADVFKDTANKLLTGSGYLSSSEFGLIKTCLESAASKTKYMRDTDITMSKESAISRIEQYCGARKVNKLEARTFAQELLGDRETTTNKEMESVQEKLHEKFSIEEKKMSRGSSM